MPFLDEIDDAREKVPGGRLPRSMLLGIVLVAAAVAIVAASVVASSARGDFVVETGASSPSAATVESSAAAGEASASSLSGGTRTCLVYVVGAVRKPGVYAVPAGARVNDVVDAAGGFSKDADRSAVNLARVVADGEQITVPAEGEEPAASAASGGGTGDGAASGTSGGKVNINTATAAELQALDGIGEVTARKIVASREAEGPFTTIEDIKRVSGIGDKKFAAIADSITV